MTKPRFLYRKTLDSFEMAPNNATIPDYMPFITELIKRYAANKEYLESSTSTSIRSSHRVKRWTIIISKRIAFIRELQSKLLSRLARCKARKSR